MGKARKLPSIEQLEKMMDNLDSYLENSKIDPKNRRDIEEELFVIQQKYHDRTGHYYPILGED